MVAIDSGAERIARSFVDDLNAAAPGLVRRVHVTGSAITDDWREGRSDVDLVVQCARFITPTEMGALDRLHRRRSGLDVLYLTTEQLAAGPEVVTAAPQAIAGKFAAAKAGAQLSWVTWLELEAGVTLDGAPVERFFNDTAVKAGAASRRNLRDYWLPLGRMAGIKFAALPPTASDMMWITLGPPRLVATIEQGRIFSKSDAGRLAADRWPDFAELIGRVLRYRETGTGSFSRSDARQSLGVLRRCVDHGVEHAGAQG
jgi:hypothetical protein